jgi:integrase
MSLLVAAAQVSQGFAHSVRSVDNRRTLACLAAMFHSHGKTMKTIQLPLRHSSSRVTAEIYTHAIPQHQRDAVVRRS